MTTINSNYQENKEGFFRKPDAPDAKHKSRINWGRLESAEQIRNAVSELRERQNRRNEEYRKRGGA